MSQTSVFVVQTQINSEGCVRKASGGKTELNQTCESRKTKFVPDRLGPGLTPTTTGAVDRQGTAGY